MKPMSKFIPQLPLLMVRMEGLPHLWALGSQPVQKEGLVEMDSNDSAVIPMWFEYVSQGIMC